MRSRVKNASNAGPVLATIGAAALFATSASARAISGVEADSVTVAASRLAVGALGLVAVSLFRGRFQVLLKLWRQPVVWLMALGVAGYQALFFIGTGRVGVAVGTLASLALGPLLAGLLAWALGAKAPSRVWWVSTGIAIGGLALLTLGGSGAGGVTDVMGVLAAVGAGGAYAVYTVFGTRLAARGFAGSDVLAASFAIGAIALLPLGLPGVGALNSGAGIALVLWLGLIATSLAYLGFGIGISRLPAGTVATLNLAEPVIATLLGVAVIGERLSLLSSFGGVLIACALGLLAVVTAKESA